MSCKFKGIKVLPADCYEVHFLVNGQDQMIFHQGIEALMMDVLDEDDYDGPSEWEKWCEDGTLPETFGHLDNSFDQGEVEYAERYFKENEDSYELDFEPVLA